LICRVLISLFSNQLVAENLEFRGGTALHKLFLNPPSRYSEDVDLVQINSGAIGPVMDAIHQALDGFLGTPKRKQAEDSVTLVYRTDSEIPPVVPLKLKVEINTREHFSVPGYREEPFSVVQTFRKYMEIEGHSVSKKDFKENLRKKMQTKSFLADTDNLLRPTITHDHQEAFRLIDEQLLTLL